MITIPFYLRFAAKVITYSILLMSFGYQLTVEECLWINEQTDCQEDG